MTLSDSNLVELLQRLSPRDRKIIADCLREGRRLPDEMRDVIRWLKRRLKRKARAGKR